MAEAGDTLGALLRECRSALEEAKIPDRGLEARLIVEHFTGATRIQTLTEPGRPVASAVAASIRDAVSRRMAGEPVHRILGVRSFYGLELRLSPATLEPRPDTETLVDAVLPLVRECVQKHGGCRILDLGTGSGAIALAILAQVPKAIVTGVDLSQEALDTALSNARAHGLDDRFSVLRSDWFQSVTGRWDVIVSNPPYIQSVSISDLSVNVRDYDPVLALDGGVDGLEAYRRIAARASNFLEETGAIGMEIGFDQCEQVGAVFDEFGFDIEKQIRDLGGNDRVLIFRNRSNSRNSQCLNTSWQ